MEARPSPPSRVPQAARLTRLVLVRAGSTEVPREQMLLGGMETGLSSAGLRELDALRRHWEWAEAVLSSPVRRARQTAARLAGDVPVRLEPALRPRDLGRWAGRSPDALRAAFPDAFARWQAGDAELELGGVEPACEFRGRVGALVARWLAGAERSLLVVSHLAVIREIARQLAGPLPSARPWPAELVLLTRRNGGFGLGRRSSDPEPLRSPLERSGLSGRPLARPPERHVAPLTLRRGPG